MTGSFDFVTGHGVRISVDFEEDFLIQSDISYQLIIGNSNQKKSPRDNKLQKTVLAIIEEFFHRNQAAVLYICETGDGKQQVRNRLFKYWFDSYEFNTKYSLYTTHIVDDEGISNFAALILKNDNPKIVDIVTEFTQTARILREKP
ncbi:MAG: DUF6169 family protein [Prevotella sp.]|nr:DUF6169 family protein [Prevotella sp.]